MNEAQSDLQRVVSEARASFPYFVNNVFRYSKDILKAGTWTGGSYVDMIAEFMQGNKRTIRVSARDHMKSMSFYAHIMWKLFQMVNEDCENQYFSYNGNMAAYHTNKIKRAIMSNPFFAEIKDMKPTAEGVLSYTWNGRNVFTVKPRGLLEFKRGIHSRNVYVDDPFQDPESKMLLGKIDKINEIMKTQILDMFWDELHIVGTAQTNQDFYFNKDFTNRFATKVLPAIVNESTKQVLWAEWAGWDELMAKKRERGERVFNQEYLCRPVYAENAFFSKERIMSVVNPQLVDYTPTRPPHIDAEDVIGGFDIGKKTHPSHLAVFRKDGRKRIQLHQKFMDGWDYVDQIAYINEVIEKFKVDIMFYDATRGEFEAMSEAGALQGEWEPVIFTNKSKQSMA